MSSRRSSVGFALSPNKRRSMAPPGALDTPLTRRQSTADSDVSLFIDENNDEREKKERQLSRLQEQMQSRSHASPTITTPGDRRKSLGSVSGLSNHQLSEHYSKCIQLSAENKISMKNAFNLQLIDYMSEMLRRKDSDMNNFQMASCTLDASTKIYAYRVDSIHTDTLKMAGGLGRTQDKDGNKEGDDLAMGEDGAEGEKRKRKTKKKAVIEANIKNLDVAHFDLEFDIDPLFKKTTSQFDEGRSGSGQFLGSLQLLDDTCRMVLDSETVIMALPGEKQQGNTELVLIPKPPDVSQKLICPTFAPFEFTSWNIADDDDSFCNTSKLDGKDDDEDNEHRFDVNAVPEPINDENYFDGDDDHGLDPMGDDDETHGTVMTVGQDHHAPPPQMEAVHLKDHLATSPSEYSYFDSRVMSAWAGPGHWRIKAKSKDKSSANTKDDSKRKKKEYINIVYEGEVDPEVEKQFSVTRKATKLTQTTFKQWSKEKTTMPVDLHYNGRDLTKLYGRPAIIIRRQQTAAAVDDSVMEYDYDNQNDADNYCADMDDGASGYGDNTVPGYDMTDIFSQTVMGSQAADKGMDLMDNLVAAPNKVAKINIGYARVAKKVDMKKLKSTMWSMLVDPSNNKENDKGLENQANPIEKPTGRMNDSYEVEFSKMYRELPSKLSSKMTENLSVPLAFIALLHLANEHSLQLTDTGDLRDFTILQG